MYPQIVVKPASVVDRQIAKLNQIDIIIQHKERELDRLKEKRSELVDHINDLWQIHQIAEEMGFTDES